MFTPEQLNQIKEVFQQMFDTNYRSGVPRVPPHRHTGVDNLKIDAADILNLPSGSAPGGSNSDVQFNDNGTFGGDPQFTFTPATGGVHLHDIDNRLDPPNETFELSIAAINGQRLLLTTNNIDTDGNILGDTADIYMATGATIPNSRTGSIDILSGNAEDGGDVSSGVSGYINLQTGTSNTETGSASLITGDVSGNPSNSGVSGDINIKTGFAYGDAGDINMQAGNSLNGDDGSINLTTNNGPITIQSQGGSGAGTGNIGISSAGDITLIDSGTAGGLILLRSNNGSGSIIDLDASGTGGQVNAHAGSGILLETPSTGNHINIEQKIIKIGYTDVDVSTLFDYDGSIAIADKFSGTPISNTPTGGGVLYSLGGALYWLGSGGTTTMIAPA